VRHPQLTQKGRISQKKGKARRPNASNEKNGQKDQRKNTSSSRKKEKDSLEKSREKRAGVGRGKKRTLAYPHDEGGVKNPGSRMENRGESKLASPWGVKGGAKKLW